MFAIASPYEGVAEERGLQLRVHCEEELALVMSAVDQRLLHTVSATPSVVVPNGVDTTAIVPGPRVREPVALFTGTLDYGPNAEGLDWLLQAVWPQMLNERYRASPTADALLESWKRINGKIPGSSFADSCLVPDTVGRYRYRRDYGH